MRKGFEGLYGLVRDRLQLEPLRGHLFVFSNAQRNRLLSHEELALLLGGIELAGSKRRAWFRRVVGEAPESAVEAKNLCGR